MANDGVKSLGMGHSIGMQVNLKPLPMVLEPKS